MNRRTANEILKEYALNATDAALLAAAICEALGERVAGLERAELMMSLRRVLGEGTEAVKKTEETMPFAEAVQQSLNACSGLRPTSRRHTFASCHARHF